MSPEQNALLSGAAALGLVPSKQHRLGYLASGLCNLNSEPAHHGMTNWHIANPTGGPAIGKPAAAEGAAASTTPADLTPPAAPPKEAELQLQERRPHIMRWQ